MTMKPITDKAEVSIDFPDKAYMGSFGRGSAYEAHADEAGIVLKLARHGGEKRVVELHLHYYLLAEIVAELARSVKHRPPIDTAHREPLQEAVAALQAALEKRKG
ncbi:MAG: hypothetical protein U1E53_24385 [Dongiaceae bacterium]